MPHDEKVVQIKKEVKIFYDKQKPFHIFHGSTNSTRIQNFKKESTIDTSFLNEIIKIDTLNRIAIVEPNVPMDKLVQATLKNNLIPAVVMEFPGITVGGAIAGVAGESSSFKYGVFAQTCTEMEVVTPDGKVLNTSKHRYEDLFDMIKGTYGTLGIITAVKIQLIPAKKYVNLTYFPVTSFEEATKTILQVTKKKHNYVDGIMFSRNQGTIIVGDLNDRPIGNIRRYSRAFDQWYYLDAKNNVNRIVSQAVPIVDYLFRYDRGAFWMGERAFKIFNKPFNRMRRLLYDPFMHTRKMYEALQASGASQQYLVQDLRLFSDKATEFMDFLDKNMNIYPIWLCPLNPKGDKAEFQIGQTSDEMCINIGAWSEAITDYNKFVNLNKKLEKELTRLSGRKWFYAQAYYTEKEFWGLYNKIKYDRIRKKYNADYLPNIFEKVKVKNKQPIEYHKGVKQAILGKAKLKVHN